MRNVNQVGCFPDHGGDEQLWLIIPSQNIVELLECNYQWDRFGKNMEHLSIYFFLVNPIYDYM